MTVNLHGTLPFAPLPEAQALEKLAPAGIDSFGHSKSVGMFQDAMATAQGQGVQVAQLDATLPAQAPNAVQSADGVTVAQAAQGTPPVQAAGGAADADAGARAAEGLDLARPNTVQGAEPTTGTTILGGLEQLRTVFDGRFDSLGGKLEGTRMDVSDMMSLQAEVIQYSVLVDVSSKLAGKSTQAMDSLMKGQ